METATPPLPASAHRADNLRPRSGLLAACLRPSYLDCLLIAVLVWLFVAASPGWERLLRDGDTGWHIRTGELILTERAVPRQDPFSFTKPGAPWFAWEWLADVFYAVLHKAWGLKAIVLLAGFQIALLAVLLVRGMVATGVHPLLALGLTLLGMGAASVHFLARPHLFTWLFLAAAWQLVERDQRHPGKVVWLLVPATALWANLHGGWLALVGSLGVLAAGRAAESWLVPAERSARRRQALKMAALAGACTAASLANPYGYHLHTHLYGYLTSDWIRQAVDEFQSPSFRHENMLHFELLLFAGVAAAAGYLRRRQVGEALLILAWAHLALQSVRHVPVFVVVAIPLLAAGCQRAWNSFIEVQPSRSPAFFINDLGREWAAGFRRLSLWSAVALTALVLGSPPERWPGDFPRGLFPLQMTSEHAAVLEGARLLTSDEWADYLLYKLHPRQRVFFDGRSDFYGEQLGREYVTLVNARGNWRALAEKHGVDAVLCPSDWPLGSVLENEPGWRLRAKDGQARLFLKNRTAAGTPVSQRAVPEGRD